MAKSVALPTSTPVVQSSTRSNGLRRAMIYVAALIVFVALWEGAKAVFALPDYKLPHISMIFKAVNK